LPGIDEKVTKIQAEQKSLFAQTEWTSIPDSRNWRWLSLARAERLNDDDPPKPPSCGLSHPTGDTIDRAMYLQ
jgi:translocation and assembly module TamA